MSYKGTSWKKHKYLKKINQIYVYEINDALDKKKYKFVTSVKRKKKQMDQAVEDKKEELDVTIAEAAEKLDDLSKRKPAKKVDIDMSLPSIDLPEIKLDQKMIERGLNFFNKAYEGFKNVNETISDSILSGIHEFNSLLSKYLSK